MNETTRTKVLNAGMITLFLSSLAPPALLAIAQNAGAGEYTQPAAILPRHILHLMGAHHIPNEITVPATLATIAIWLTAQMSALYTNARDGQPAQVINEKGLHFTTTFVWAGSAHLPLKESGISPLLQHATLAITLTALAGIIWRIAVLRDESDHPNSSIIGHYVLPATSTIKKWLQRTAKPNA